MTQTVLVAGAGPSGLVAAIQLARAGRDVIILAPCPSGHKIGECVPGAINRFLAKHDLPQIVQSEDEHRRISGATSLWAGELRREDFLTSIEGFGWRLNRFVFEKRLEGVAIESGAQRRLGRVVHLSQSVDCRWQVSLDDGSSLVVDQIVDATGRNSVIARKQTAVFHGGHALIGIWAIGKTAAADSTSRTLIESDEDGWWYAAFLPDSRPLVIYHTSPEWASHWKCNRSLWVEKLKETQLISSYIRPETIERKTLRIANARPCWIDPCFGSGWVACGDAAMTLDPISSQGIFNAMATGAMAASALIDNDRHGAMLRYRNRLAQIRNVYQRRREIYYGSGYRYFGTHFWRQQCRYRSDSARDQA